MKVSIALRFRVVLAILATTLGVLAMSGCSGGWGEFKPAIARQQGQAQTVIAGHSATFAVAATGTGPFAYQWYLNGVPINGATSSSYTIAATTGSQNGSVYTVAVTNAGGTAMSAPYILTVDSPPTITSQPSAQSIIVGQTATFTANATGTAPLSYQWYQGPTAIGGATAASYTTPVTTATGSTAYSVIVTNMAGNATSATAPLTVMPIAPTLSFAAISAQTYGGAAFAVSATSASSGAVTYTVASGPATIAGNMVTTTGAGTVVLNASQAASGNYAAATASTSFSVADSIPVASSLTGSSSTPVSGASIQLIPTFSGGTAVIGTAGAGSSNVAAALVSGSSYPSPAITSATTFTLTVTGTAGNSVSTTFTATPGNLTISAVTPANQAMAPGTQTFSATVSGGTTNNVTWSASQGSITSGGVWTSPDTPGAYTITATSVEEPSISAATTITVTRPVITVQPMSKNACSGYNPSLSLAAGYAASYQWYFNGSSVGTDSPILTFPNVTSASNGSYTCAITNAAGTTTSNAVTLNVVSATTLTITKQPASVSVYSTQTATFSVAASGTGTLAYQWYSGTPGSGTAISGATSSTYTTSALTAANDGTTYYATVSDPDCTGATATSTAATLSVSAADTTVPPSIVVQPLGQTISVGASSTTFSVTASGSGTLTYQWYRVPYSSTELTNPTAGSAISGATQATYTVPASASQQSNDGDNYYVVVTNNYGSAVSSRAVLAVGAGIVLQIAAEPQTQYAAANTLASFSVAATCTGCVPAYQWFWYAPGSTTVAALTNGAVSSGALSGATVAGASTSSLTLANLPASASGAIFYAVISSTSDGTSPIPGTNPLTSSTAGLFVNTLGTIGAATPGDGLCNTGGASWVLNGNTPGTSIGDVPYQNTTSCTMELTNDQGSEHAAVYWPTLISTAKFTVSFTVAITATNGTPADGFTMVLADPSQGATTASLGAEGQGLGADGIPGFVVGFDTYQNGDKQNDPGCGSCDPVPVPYMAVGQGASSLWENPWTFVNGNLDTQNSADYTPEQFTNATHSYVVSVVGGIMTVTMDGNELFTGTVSLPPVAYLGFTASTGGAMEAVTFSNLTATVSAP